MKYAINASLFIPSLKELLSGFNEFRKSEERDAMYDVSMFVINKRWGNDYDVANGLGVLLLTWNQAFYRYGIFNFYKLEKCITKNKKLISSFRRKKLELLNKGDEIRINKLFKDFLETLKISSGKSKGKKSPVAVAKALHLLAPKFFPLWDDKIARVYGCGWNDSKTAPNRYIEFCKKMRHLIMAIKDYKYLPDGNLIKLLDEYNYSKYTKHWI